MTTVDSLAEESYSLEVTAKGVVIAGGSGAGLFYGVQSLMQLFPPDPANGNNLPFVSIMDSPRFPYRGLHLDVGRHMFPVAFIKKYIDLLAYHKFNYFHWHLTEDHGWRIEIKKYPKLPEVSAYRKETVVGRHDASDVKFDGQRHGGYYTQDEIKEVVRYAADRYVTVELRSKNRLLKE